MRIATGSVFESLTTKFTFICHADTVLSWILYSCEELGVGVGKTSTEIYSVRLFRRRNREALENNFRLGVSRFSFKADWTVSSTTDGLDLRRLNTESSPTIEAIPDVVATGESSKFDSD